MNKFKFKALSTFVMSIINIIISIFLAKQFGAPGAAFGTCISIILCNFLVMNIYYKKVIKLDVIRFWKNILVIMAKLMIPVGVTLGIIYATKLTGVKAFLTYGMIYVIMYVLTTYFIVLNGYEKKLTNKFLNKIHFIIII